VGAVSEQIREHLGRTHVLEGLSLEEAADAVITHGGQCQWCGYEATTGRARVRAGDRRPFVCDNCGAEVSLSDLRCPTCRIAFDGYRDETGDSGDKRGASREVG